MFPRSAFTKILCLALFPLPCTKALPQEFPPSAPCFNVQNFHAVADGKTKCTQAIADAIAAASAKGGGVVFFPAGVYFTGPIHLRSHITLYLDAGATVKFSDDFDDYLPMVRSRWEGIEVENFSPLIYADGAEDIAICGRGRLDGKGAKWWETTRKISADEKQGNKTLNKWQESFLKRNAAIVSSAKYELLNVGFLRPPFIQTRNCTNVLIDGITIVDSPFWTINPVYCENVTVHGVVIDNPESSPNTDGINPDSCRNVHISDCQINSGDDCITIKSGRDADGRRMGRPAENYTIINCTMAKGHGLSIGSEMSAGVRNITIANCTFDGTDRGIRIKSMRGRGGFVENVRVSNITMHNVSREAILVTLNYKATEAEPVSERTPLFQNIDFSGITGNAAVAGRIMGLAERPIQRLRFTDFRLDTQTGFKVMDAAEIEFHNVTVNTEKGAALSAERVQDLELNHFTTTKPHPKTPVIDISNGTRIFAHGCVAAPGTETFLSLDETTASQLTLEANSLSQAKTAVVKANRPK